ncbi:hypothetical protein EYF80_031102 [Liparis tanakae]|uniref:Uncharacterized protein n=1 Tax=Liparis tanakae TaxID=230148 RepID=A0A4Z2GYJ9_9TELE|nr:hypothetical protein EYF80_031102 [Liparis tanakae]
MLMPMANVSVANRAWEREVGVKTIVWTSVLKQSQLYLYEALGEEDLYGLFEDGQQASVVNADPPLQQRQHMLHLRSTESVDGQDSLFPMETLGKNKSVLQ